MHSAANDPRPQMIPRPEMTILRKNNWIKSKLVDKLDLQQW